MSTIYGSFVDAAAAERAAGALLDRGARASDVSVIANESYGAARVPHMNANAIEAEQSAKTGISTTTPGDVAAGAVKGTAIGIGVGALAALAALMIPGLGLVIGGGALATALAGAAATTVAGTAAGAVTGYLHDQGVGSDYVTRYSNNFAQGGAIIAIAVPTGNISTEEVEATLAKYGATDVATVNAARTAIDAPVLTNEPIPLVVTEHSPDINPIVVDHRPATATVITDPITGAPREVVQPATYSPVTGSIQPAVIETVAPGVVYPALDPVTGVAIDTATGFRATGVTPVVTVDPVTGAAVNQTVVTAPRATYIDPVTGVGSPVGVDPVSGMPIPSVPGQVVVRDGIVKETTFVEEEVTPAVIDERRATFE